MAFTTETDVSAYRLDLEQRERELTLAKARVEDARKQLKDKQVAIGEKPDKTETTEKKVEENKGEKVEVKTTSSHNPFKGSNVESDKPFRPLSKNGSRKASR